MSSAEDRVRRAAAAKKATADKYRRKAQIRDARKINEVLPRIARYAGRKSVNPTWITIGGEERICWTIYEDRHQTGWSGDCWNYETVAHYVLLADGTVIDRLRPCGNGMFEEVEITDTMSLPALREIGRRLNVLSSPKRGKRRWWGIPYLNEIHPDQHLYT